ncbi:MAG TPA: hypothetical protein VKA15_22160 [Isosphaeraceae bacterium]|nr:hypothetical protein [Isosphaeraceae bacterium]
MTRGWILGSASFVRRLKGELRVEPTARGTPQAKASLEDRLEIAVEQVLLAVADYDGLSPCDLGRIGEHAQARSIVL